MFASSSRRPSAAAGRLLALAAILLLLLPLLVPLSPGATAPLAAPAAAQPPTAPDRARVEAGLRSSPVMFIENVGQFGDRARFQVRGATGTMWLAEAAVWIAVVEQTPPPAPPRYGEGGQETCTAPPLSLTGRGSWG